MRFRRLLGFALLAASFAACGRTSPEKLPELEVVGGLPPGFTWRLENGPDFYVYKGRSPAQSGSEVGVSFGNAPTFSPNPEASPEIGSFAGRAVAWEASVRSAGTQRRDALLPYRHAAASPEVKLHLWAQAASREQLADLLRALGGTTIRERGAPGPREKAP